MPCFPGIGFSMPNAAPIERAERDRQARWQMPTSRATPSGAWVPPPRPRRWGPTRLHRSRRRPDRRSAYRTSRRGRRTRAAAAERPERRAVAKDPVLLHPRPGLRRPPVQRDDRRIACRAPRSSSHWPQEHRHRRGPGERVNHRRDTTRMPMATTRSPIARRRSRRAGVSGSATLSGYGGLGVSVSMRIRPSRSPRTLQSIVAVMHPPYDEISSIAPTNSSPAIFPLTGPLADPQTHLEHLLDHLAEAVGGRTTGCAGWPRRRHRSVGASFGSGTAPAPADVARPRAAAGSNVQKIAPPRTGSLFPRHVPRPCAHGEGAPEARVRHLRLLGPDRHGGPEGLDTVDVDADDLVSAWATPVPHHRRRKSSPRPLR